MSDLLRAEHLRIRSLGIIQKDLLNGWPFPKLAQRLDTVEDPLIRILVNLHSHKLRLPNTNDRSHD